MAVICGLKLWDYHHTLKNQEDAIDANIRRMEDIEGIAQNYEDSVASYTIVKNFADGTVSDNEMVLQFITDLESILPSDAHINKFQSVNGICSFEVVGTTKREVADIIIKMKKLDYVSGVGLTKVADGLAEYALGILPVVDEQGRVVEDATVERSVEFPIAVQLKNAQGTAVSDEVAAALAGSTNVDLSGATEAVVTDTTDEGGLE